jgi:ATP-dependent RNA circularization protein (DNA/RNA ligase family)
MPSKIYFKKIMKNIKKDIMDVKNINVIVGENEISFKKINENKNNFIGNLYNHELPIFGSQLSLK